MEAVVLAAVLTLSLIVAVAAAWASLTLAIAALDRAAAWTPSPASAPAWAQEAPIAERAASRQPLAA